MSELVKQWYGLCIWRDLYLNREVLPTITTFGDCDKWDVTHPLYMCILCEGLDDGCKDYQPLNPVKRKLIRDERRKLII
jgi:hypothetical protein